MRLIALLGLVIVEKMELTAILAAQLVESGQRVAVIDNLSRLTLDPAQLSGAAYTRLADDLETILPPLLDDLEADVLLLAVSETTPPDDSFVLLDRLREIRPGLETQTLALIDTRTCDCFPQTRIALEASADVVVNLPAEFEAVLEVL
jgi:hypothetical protein